MKERSEAKYTKKQLFIRGLKNGLPIGLGYLSVSVSFGLLAVSLGFPVWFAVLLSMTNLTSAGQFSGVNMISSGCTLSALAITQFVINIRYSLMSVSLSQKAGKSMNLVNRLISGFFITDEIFAVAYKEDEVEAAYIYGLGAISFAGWTTGTLFGALFGSLLPEFLLKPLSAALYAMFIAIIVPEAKRCKGVLYAVLCAVGLHCILRLTPLTEFMGSGMTMIICAVVAAAAAAVFFPHVSQEEEKV